MPRLYNTLPSLNDILAANTGYEVVNELVGPVDATLIFRRTKAGGVDDPAPYITNPKTTLVIAGKDTEAGIRFAEAALNAGVSEENIIILSGNQQLYPDDVAKKIKELVSVGILAFSWEEAEEVAPSPSPTSSGRVKTISVTGYRGGVGRTTFSASLAFHFAAFGERISLLDLGSPPALRKHLTVKETEKLSGFTALYSEYCTLYLPDVPVWLVDCDQIAELVDKLKKEFRRVIIDFPAEIPPGLYEAVNPDLEITVMDSDIEQTVKPIQNKNGLLVYNKESPEFPVELVESILSTHPLAINYDEIGCQAALLSGVPAYDQSETIAECIGIIVTVK